MQLNRKQRDIATLFSLGAICAAFIGMIFLSNWAWDHCRGMDDPRPMTHQEQEAMRHWAIGAERYDARHNR